MSKNFSRTLSALLPPHSTSSYQFAAILGDLQHKLDVYLTVGTYGPIAEAYFPNSAQATWLRTHYPELVPPPAQPGQPPSDHTLGTVFEFHYYSDLPFRVNYLTWLRAQQHLTLPSPVP